MNDRHDLALYRTLLASERTVAAWIRTGLGALVAGIVVEKFIVGVMPAWNVRLLAMILFLFSMFAFCVAVWHRDHSRLVGHRVLTAMPRWLLVVAAALLALAGIWIVAPAGAS